MGRHGGRQMHHAFGKKGGSLGHSGGRGCNSGGRPSHFGSGGSRSKGHCRDRGHSQLGRGTSSRGRSNSGGDRSHTTIGHVGNPQHARSHGHRRSVGGMNSGHSSSKGHTKASKKHPGGERHSSGGHGPSGIVSGRERPSAGTLESVCKLGGNGGSLRNAHSRRRRHSGNHVGLHQGRRSNGGAQHRDHQKDIRHQGVAAPGNGCSSRHLQASGKDHRHKRKRGKKAAGFMTAQRRTVVRRTIAKNPHTVTTTIQGEVRLASESITGLLGVGAVSFKRGRIASSAAAVVIANTASVQSRICGNIRAEHSDKKWCAKPHGAVGAKLRFSTQAQAKIHGQRGRRLVVVKRKKETLKRSDPAAASKRLSAKPRKKPVAVASKQPSATAPQCLVRPSDVRFSQQSISDTFRDGHTLKDMQSALARGTLQKRAIPPIRVFKTSRGNFVSHDNRRLAVYKNLEAQGSVGKIKVQLTKKRVPKWKWSTLTRGLAVRLKTKKLGKLSSSDKPESKPTPSNMMVMFHGTSREAAAKIMTEGFRASPNGMLGSGVYLSRDIDKASRYGPAILKVSADLGRVKCIDHQSHALQKTWSDHGYDSAWCPPNCGMVPSGLEEDCVRDASRVKVISRVL
eukprot:TRINITY_DN49524_c0_g1_i1.p1 TRINITY_DN49524_c0_g1~~TRINITY_DN49524_c0_g1_i1.p1  ORF type:complete len:624 (+),score=74.43 TRINITY_DN49524_c0_g1_i1:168-2039(+)